MNDRRTDRFFGGPRSVRDDVLPFLENVLRGHNVPRERMLRSPSTTIILAASARINAQNRALIRALRAELAQRGPQLPVYWGNRNWHPLLPDTLAQMAARRNPPGDRFLHFGL